MHQSAQLPVCAGCQPLSACEFDAGAIRVVNAGAVPKTVDYVTVDFDGCVFDIWPHHTVLAPSGQLIMSQTLSSVVNQDGAY